MNFKEALLLMADRTRFTEESELNDVKGAITEALTLPEETQADDADNPDED